MAKRECPFCKEKVKENALICMHCKSDLPPLPPKKWYQTWKGLLLLLFGLGVLGRAVENPQPKPAPTPQEVAAKQEDLDSIEARTFAKIYVEKTLKAPSTTSFQNVLDFGVGQKKDKKGKKIKDVWNVSGYVDAQNSFGAMIRTQFWVTLKKVNGSWILLDLQSK